MCFVTFLCSSAPFLSCPSPGSFVCRSLYFAPTKSRKAPEKRLAASRRIGSDSNKSSLESNYGVFLEWHGRLLHLHALHAREKLHVIVHVGDACVRRLQKLLHRGFAVVSRSSRKERPDYAKLEKHHSLLPSVPSQPHPHPAVQCSKRTERHRTGLKEGTTQLLMSRRHLTRQSPSFIAIDILPHRRRLQLHALPFHGAPSANAAPSAENTKIATRRQQLQRAPDGTRRSATATSIPMIRLHCHLLRTDGRLDASILHRLHSASKASCALVRKGERNHGSLAGKTSCLTTSALARHLSAGLRPVPVGPH